MSCHIQNTRKDKVGSVCRDYANVMNMTVIGKGGFGKVYLYTSPSGSELAIKREKKVLKDSSLYFDSYT